MALHSDPHLHPDISESLGSVNHYMGSKHVLFSTSSLSSSNYVTSFLSSTNYAAISLSSNDCVAISPSSTAV